METEAEQPEHDSKDRTAGDGTTVAFEIEHVEQDHSDMTAGIGQQGKNSQDRTVGTGQSQQVGLIVTLSR